MHVSLPRHIRIFKTGRNQAIHMPRALELPVNEVTIRREGNRFSIEPVERHSLLELIAAWQPLDVDFAEVSDEKPEAVAL
jgi:antitoxin VapB